MLGTILRLHPYTQRRHVFWMLFSSHLILSQDDAEPPQQPTMAPLFDGEPCTRLSRVLSHFFWSEFLFLLQRKLHLSDSFILSTAVCSCMCPQLTHHDTSWDEAGRDAYTCATDSCDDIENGHRPGYYAAQPHLFRADRHAAAQSEAGDQ